MRVIPAIDLMGGKCVRLVKGEKDKTITYGKNALELAEEYWKMNTEMLHVVDLDGAFTGEMENIGIISSLAKRFPIQVGGGIRSESKIKELLGLGVKKVIVSTLLFKDPTAASKIKRKYSGQLIGSFDFKDGKLSYAGWTKQTEMTFEEASTGLAEIVVTDVGSDGTLKGPNIELLQSIVGRSKAKVIAAGGVRDIKDLIELESIGVDAAIVGRAFLENWIDVRDIRKFGIRRRD